MTSPTGSHRFTTGACLCGKITYRLEKPPIYNVVCHCTNCRRVTGSTFLTASIYPKEALTIASGESLLKAFIDNTTDSGKPLTRQFCSECGSPLFIKTPLNEDIVSIAAGSMDNVGEWAPSKEQYHRNKAGWLPELKDVDKHVSHPWSMAPEGMPDYKL